MSSYNSIDFYLKKEMSKFKENFFKNKEELNNHHSLLYKNFLFLQKQEERILNENQHFLRSEAVKVFALSGISLLFLFLHFFEKTKFAENEMERNAYLNKLQEINNNFELYKKIERDYFFVQSKELIVEKLMNTKKTIEEIRQNQIQFLENMKKAEEKIQKDKNFNKLPPKKVAFLVGIEFDKIAGLTRKNVFFAKDYLNHKFNTNLSIKDMIKIKEISKNDEKLDKITKKEKERDLTK